MRDQCCAHLLRCEPTAAPASTCAPLSARPYADTSASDCSHQAVRVWGGLETTHAHITAVHTQCIAAHLGPKLQHEQADRKFPAPLAPCCMRHMCWVSQAIDSRCVEVCQLLLVLSHIAKCCRY